MTFRVEGKYRGKVMNTPISLSMTLAYPSYTSYYSLSSSPSLLLPTSTTMPNSPTPNAPRDYDELIKLLENDTKVKVAGELLISFRKEQELISRYRC